MGKIRYLILAFIVACVVAVGCTPKSPPVTSPKVGAVSPYMRVPTGTGFAHVTGGVQDNAAQAVSGGGWVTSLDCDVSAESTVNLFAAGGSTTPVSFSMCGGWSCTAEPNIFGRGSADFINGTGLTIACANGGSGYGNFFGTSVKNAPLVWCALSALPTPIANVDYSTSFRIWADVTGQTITDGSSTGAFFGLDNNPTQGATDTDWYSMIALRGAATTTQPKLYAITYFGAGGTANTGFNIVGQTAWNSVSETTMLEIPALVPNYVGNWAAYGAAWSSGWPVVRPWATQASTWQGFAGTDGIGNVNSTLAAIGTKIGFVAGIGCASGSNFDTFNIKRLRVDYRL